MDNIDNKIRLEKARLEIDQGSCKLAYEILQPLIHENHPEALFLYSQFSFDSGESTSAFERRSIELLKKSAELGYAPAIFALGSCYESGDLIEENQNLAAYYYASACELGYSKAKFYHALNLFYGSYGIPKNSKKALELMNQASLEGIDAAREFVAQLAAEKEDR